MLFRMFDENKVILNEINKVKFFTFPLFEKTGLVRSVFSTRSGGVSTGIYSEMNLSLKLEDSRENVLENIELFTKAVGFDKEKIVMSNQTHTNKVRCVDESDFQTGLNKPGFDTDVDGLITNVPGLVLMTFYADCVPVYFLDPVNKVIAISHSGWKGTFDEIAKVTVETMSNNYGTKPENLLALTGPSICKDCYEVSIELGEKFASEFPRAKECIDFSNGKCHLDLCGIIKHTLINSGVKKENIVISDVCTCCNSELLHSHRATGGKRGLNAAMMCLKD